MITTVILIVALPTIAAIATIGLLRAGIAREDSDHSIKGQPPTRASAFTRCMVGLYVRTPSHGGGDADDDWTSAPPRQPPSSRRRSR
jgi:hypothetical protein